MKEVFDRIGKDTLGYDADCFCVQVLVSQQSTDIAQGVDKGGAGDQGMMSRHPNERSCILHGEEKPESGVSLPGTVPRHINHVGNQGLLSISP